MSAPLPFKVSPEAEERLLRAATLPDMQPGISYTLAYDVHSREGELTEEYRGEHYSIGYDTREAWRTGHMATQVQIAGHEFWITSSTLDTLRGRTLSVIRRDVGRGKHAGTFRDILVAA